MWYVGHPRQGGAELLGRALRSTLKPLAKPETDIGKQTRLQPIGQEQLAGMTTSYRRGGGHFAFAESC